MAETPFCLKVIVCGSRSYGRERLADGTLGGESFDLAPVLRSSLHGLYEAYQQRVIKAGYPPPECTFKIIEGGARGADRLARMWAEAHAAFVGDGGPEGMLVPIVHQAYEADWVTHSLGAGPIRNRKMLEEENPTGVLAFVDKPLFESRGTRHMVDIAHAAGVNVVVFENPLEAQ